MSLESRDLASWMLAISSGSCGRGRWSSALVAPNVPLPDEICYALAKDVKDEDLKKRILAKVYRLTATN